MGAGHAGTYKSSVCGLYGSLMAMGLASQFALWEFPMGVNEL